MRVIGGEFRSRSLKSVPGLDVRPTPDRLREALFNVLAPRIEGTIFVDLYAGTGAVGIEAISRGAARAIFVEQNRSAVQVLRENLAVLHTEGRAQVRQGKAVTVYPQLERADIVFLDPPYPHEQEYERILTLLGENPPALTIVQHSSHFYLRERYGAIQRSRVLKQGENTLCFFEPGVFTGDSPDSTHLSNSSE